MNNNTTDPSTNLSQDPKQIPNLRHPKLNSILESLFFVADRPIDLKELQELLPEFTKPQLVEALEDLRELKSQENSGISLFEIDNGFQFRTIAANADWVSRFTKVKPQRLSRASLETLSIIAYRQPLTRPEIDDIRGVDSSGVIKMLMEKNFIKILGKKEEAGHPLLYGTTKFFMSFFNLKNLSDLPPLQEYTELGEESLAKLQKLFPEGLDVEKNLQSENMIPIESAETPSAGVMESTA